MKELSASVRKPDHDVKASGRALYIDDESVKGVLFAKVVHSTHACARLLDISLPPMPEGYSAVSAQDIPGRNAVHVIEDDMPVFAEDRVSYIGEPILMIAGPQRTVVERLCAAVEIRYEAQSPMTTMEAASELFYEKEFQYGDMKQAFAEADFIFEETFRTGHQEHAYLEPQGMLAYPEGDRMILRGSLQCPYYVHAAVAQALGLAPEQVRVVQSQIGGGFGGKEDYPSHMACMVAVAARALGQPVRLVYDRGEDMECTSKRHPSRSLYRAAVKNGHVTAMDIDVTLNAGAYKTLSLVVLQRSMICANGAYSVENLRVRGRAVKTNTAPNGAFRGFGDPQVFFAVELFMSHLAHRLGREAWDFKQQHLARQGDHNSTRGLFHESVPLPEMMARMDDACHYREKRRIYEHQTGRYRRGIGMGLHFHGTGFASTKDLADGIKVRLRKDADGTVWVLAANTDMGQGLSTALRKIVGAALDLPYDSIQVPEPDTDQAPNSGPTVASRSLLTVGEMVRRAAVRLKEDWRQGEAQIVEEGFLPPEQTIPFDPDRFYGDPYPAYAWGVAAVELEVDTLTGMTSVLKAYGIFDVGTVIDENIVRGQMEGGILQGIGYAAMEQMEADSKGRIRNNSYSDYIIPTAADVPDIQVETHSSLHPDGPFGAKGAGELPNGGVPQAYIEAMEQALGGCSIHHIPFTPENTLNAWEGQSHGSH